MQVQCQPSSFAGFPLKMKKKPGSGVSNFESRFIAAIRDNENNMN